VAVRDACPCGTGQPYPRCCGRWHAGEAAPDAAALMRSRYSAYVLKLRDHLLASWHPSTRPGVDALPLDEAPDARTTWLGLDVKQHVATGEHRAEVEFVARYRVGGGSAVRMVERSRFVREDGRWYYVDGDLR